MRARHTYKAEGKTALFRRAFTYIFVYLRRWCFQNDTYYLREVTIPEEDEADCLPRIQDLTFSVVSTNQQADELVKDGFNDFRQQRFLTSEALDKGAVAFCIFVGHELANIGLIAMADSEKIYFDQLPYYVDFANNQACGGGAYTNPKYRRMGLNTYRNYQMRKYLRQRGVKSLIGSVLTSNIPSVNFGVKEGQKIYAKARYLKILWWNSWKEIQV